jgi:hypothetical protein
MLQDGFNRLKKEEIEVLIDDDVRDLRNIEIERMEFGNGRAEEKMSERDYKSVLVDID